MSEEQEQKADENKAPEPAIDPRQMERLLEEARSHQNLASGALAGAVVALVCAFIWAGITLVTKYQLGLMAIALGIAVGFAVRKFGRGVDISFGVTGAVEALLGCLLGNLLIVCLVIANQTDVPFMVILSRLSPDLIVSLISKTFDPMDLLFYGIATYEGYKFAFYRLKLPAKAQS